MSGTLKKTITWLAILAILGVTIFGIVWLSNNFGKLQSGTDLYTKEDLDKKYDEGYKKGQEEGEQWRVKYQEAIKNLSVAENSVKSLQAQRDELERQIELNSGEMETLKSQLKELESELQKQKNEVKRLNSLLEELEALKNGRAEVNFYFVNYEGQDELLTTKLVTKNQPMKDVPTFEMAGYNFEGWTTNRNDVIDLQSTNVQEDTNFYAKTTFKILEECSWDEINTISESGYASNVFNVGDKKTVHINYDYSIYGDEDFVFLILGFNHDDKTDGSGKAGITFGMRDCIYDYDNVDDCRMNLSKKENSGWDKSKMRLTTLPKIFSYLSNDLQQVIKVVNKNSSTANGDSTIITSCDKLWLLCEEEICGENIWGPGNEGTIYEYWATVKDGSTSENRIKYQYPFYENPAGTSSWHLRTTSISLGTGSQEYGYQFADVDSSGGINLNVYGGASGISFCFCV